MAECLGDDPDHLKSTAFPQLHRTLICIHNEIELHRPEAPLPGAGERMFAHGAGDASSLRLLGSYVPAVGYVRPAAALIGLQEIGAEDSVTILGNKYLMTRREPIT